MPGRRWRSSTNRYLESAVNSNVLKDARDGEMPQLAALERQRESASARASLLVGSHYRTRARARAEASLGPVVQFIDDARKNTSSCFVSDQWTGQESDRSRDDIWAGQISEGKSDLVQVPGKGLPRPMATSAAVASIRNHGGCDRLTRRRSKIPGKPLLADWACRLTDPTIDTWIAASPIRSSTNGTACEATLTTAPTIPRNLQPSDTTSQEVASDVVREEQRLPPRDKSNMPHDSRATRIGAHIWLDPANDDMVSFFMAMGNIVFQRALRNRLVGFPESMAPGTDQRMRSSLSWWFPFWSHLSKLSALLWLIGEQALASFLVPLFGLVIGLVVPDEDGSMATIETFASGAACASQLTAVLGIIEQSILLCLSVAEWCLIALQRFLIGMDTRLEACVASESLLSIFCSYHSVLLLFLIIFISVFGLFLRIIVRIHTASTTRLVWILAGIWGCLHLLELDMALWRCVNQARARLVAQHGRLRARAHGNDTAFVQWEKQCPHKSAGYWRMLTQ
jgi:hypothetical protein